MIDVLVIDSLPDSLGQAMASYKELLGWEHLKEFAPSHKHYFPWTDLVVGTDAPSAIASLEVRRGCKEDPYAGGDTTGMGNKQTAQQ